jgi:hypothetical protein
VDGADLPTWAPPRDQYDLVICLYVHVAGPVEELVRRLSAGVAPGGTLLLVGHRPVDPATGAPTPAAGQVQISVEEAVAALHPPCWEILIAEERPRQASRTGVDAVVRAQRPALRDHGRQTRTTQRPFPVISLLPAAPLLLRRVRPSRMAIGGHQLGRRSR